MKIYINGVQDANTVAAFNDVGDGTGTLYLGYDPDTAPVLAGGEAYFNGLLDEVGWYNRTLSQAEVTSLNDGTPAAFGFTPQTGVPLNTSIESNPATLTGFYLPAAITVSGGEYALSSDNGATWGNWTSVAGTISPDSQVKLRLTSASAVSTLTTATLTIGATSGAFNVTTAASCVSGTGLVSWWKAENNADDTLGSNNGLNTISMTVAENQTATASCGGGGTITSFTSVYGADPNWSNCGSCTIGLPSCSVTYNNTTCTPDPYPGHVKQGKLALVCSDGLFVPGKDGQAFNFDGSTTISVPHSSSLDISSGHSVAFWVKFAANPASGKSFSLVNKWTDRYEDKQVSIDEYGKVHYFLFGTSGSGVTSTSAVTPGVWTHVAATYDGANMKIYLNGVPDASAAASGDVADSTGKLYFGYNPDRASQGNEEPFNGQLDEVLWYNRALSETEVGKLMPAPTISGITPASGPATGGTTVTITGSNLTNATAVKFAATDAASFSVTSDTQATATSPAGVVGQAVDLTVTTPGGTSATSSGDQFTYTLQYQAKNQSSGTSYTTLAEAISVASAGHEIRAYGGQFDGAFSLVRDIILSGGYNLSFSAKDSLPTTLNGSLTVNGGVAKVDSVTVKGTLTIQGGSLQVDGVVVQ